MNEVFEKERNFIPLQFVEGLLKKTVFAFMSPLEAQVEELSRRIERLNRRTDKIFSDQKQRAPIRSPLLREE